VDLNTQEIFQLKRTIPNNYPYNFSSTEYEDTNSWSMGYVDIDDDTTAVYIVDAPYDDVLAINANKIEAIADITGQTPAAVADSIQIEGYKPVAIPYNGFTFIVAPIMNADVRDEQ